MSIILTIWILDIGTMHCMTSLPGQQVVVISFNGDESAHYNRKLPELVYTIFGKLKLKFGKSS